MTHFKIKKTEYGYDVYERWILSFHKMNETPFKNLEETEEFLEKINGSIGYIVGYE